MKSGTLRINHASSWLSVRTGAWAISLAMLWMAGPRPMWGQWTTGSGGAIYYNGGKVGIGTTTPGATLQIGNPPNVVGAMSTTLASYAGELGGSAGNDLTLASIAFGSENTSALGIHGYRVSAGLGWTTTAIGIGMDVDNTTRAGANVWLNANGNVGIGTTDPQHLLHVAGTIGAEEVLVTSTGADYVFQPDYHLRPLGEVAKYIEANHRLPDIPSADEVKQKGMGVGEMEAKLLAKIEELTLHMIQEHERNDQLASQNRDLLKQVRELQVHIEGLVARQ